MEVFNVIGILQTLNSMFTALSNALNTGAKSRAGIPDLQTKLDPSLSTPVFSTGRTFQNLQAWSKGTRQPTAVVPKQPFPFDMTIM